MTDDLVSSTQQTYDRIAQAYDDQSRPAAPEFDAFRAAFARRVRGRAVDLGCGPGRDLERMTSAGLDMVGIDLSPGMLALARRRGRVVRGDLRRPPLRPASVGGLWSSASLLHVPREDVPATLAAWRALLVPGGVLGLSTSLGSDEGWEKVPYAGPGPGGGALHRWFVHHEEDALVELVLDAGFTVVSTARRTSNRDWLMLLAEA